MKDNWAVRQAQTVGEKDFIFLEKPDVRKYLDGLLLRRFWPVIKQRLQASGYSFYPQRRPKTEFVLYKELARSLTFLLLDGNKVFFRGTLECSVQSWMLHKEFFLSLSKETDPQVVFEILGNSRLRGNPPTLVVDKSNTADFYQITFRGGLGASWGLRDEEDLKEHLSSVIEVNIHLYESSLDGILTREDLGNLLSMVYQSYEAY